MTTPELAYIDLPDYFTRLLCSNMQNGEDNFKNLASYINSNPGFKGLVKRSFLDVDEKGRIETIVKSLGWFGFRNRMSALFLEYQLNGQFPIKPNLELCHELVALEEKVKSQTVEGFSRAFLLGFYWKLHRYKDNNQFVDSFNWIEIQDLLKHSKAKVIKIDWLLFSILHLQNFLGKEVVREALKGSADYKDLYESLDEKQKRIYIQNSLSYGASINEPEFFYQSRI
jgi:hypothetical protein